ncbi:hypothetical protein PTD2_18925 [Pseudoalteromonas tunicata D2]|uniref:Uncharacterized protein n=1 Tax=Pseudoalteromonas tunicata D2 TaxID=87626 RepID=A4CC38_9GAMM|nr:hypothetical protein PTD2_18925 [Pseudoalteromonas tunicata D2]
MRAFCLSKLPVGSSAKTKSGSLTNARAIATRCLSPPESSDGLWLMRWPRPTRSSMALAFILACSAFIPPINNGIAVFSSAVNSISK